MTRKRFVKLLMGNNWYDRNHANQIASHLIKDYAQAFKAIKEWNTIEYWN